MLIPKADGVEKSTEHAKPFRLSQKIYLGFSLFDRCPITDCLQIVVIVKISNMADGCISCQNYLMAQSASLAME